MIKYIVASVFVFSLILGAKGINYKKLYCNDRDFIPNQYYPHLDCKSNAFTLSVTRVHKIKFVNEYGPDCSLVHEVLNDPSRFNNIRKIKAALETFEWTECNKEMDENDEHMLELNEDDVENEDSDAQNIKCNGDIKNPCPDICKSEWESDKKKRPKRKSQLEGANYKELYCNNQDFVPNECFPRLDCKPNDFTLSVTCAHKIKFVKENKPDCLLVHEVLNDPSRFNNINKIKVALKAFKFYECHNEIGDSEKCKQEHAEETDNKKSSKCTHMKNRKKKQCEDKKANYEELYSDDENENPDCLSGSYKTDLDDEETDDIHSLKGSNQQEFYKWNQDESNDENNEQQLNDNDQDEDKSIYTLDEDDDDNLGHDNEQELDDIDQDESDDDDQGNDNEQESDDIGHDERDDDDLGNDNEQDTDDIDQDDESDDNNLGNDNVQDSDDINQDKSDDDNLGHDNEQESDDIDHDERDDDDLGNDNEQESDDIDHDERDDDDLGNDNEQDSDEINQDKSDDDNLGHDNEQESDEIDQDKSEDNDLGNDNEQESDDIDQDESDDDDLGNDDVQESDDIVHDERDDDDLGNDNEQESDDIDQDESDDDNLGNDNEQDSDDIEQDERDDDDLGNDNDQELGDIDQDESDDDNLGNDNEQDSDDIEQNKKDDDDLGNDNEQESGDIDQDESDDENLGNKNKQESDDIDHDEKDDDDLGNDNEQEESDDIDQDESDDDNLGNDNEQELGESNQGESDENEEIDSDSVPDKKHNDDNSRGGKMGNAGQKIDNDIGCNRQMLLDNMEDERDGERDIEQECGDSIKFYPRSNKKRPTNYKELYCKDKDFIPNEKYPHLECREDAIALALSCEKKISFITENGPDCPLLHHVTADPSQFKNKIKIKDALERFKILACHQETNNSDIDQYIQESKESGRSKENKSTKKK
ncbi:PREDICTED: uncharacterized protein DDB_G0290685-like [Amphimedon queenslandica]|uniref:Uncharacterized protein n=1 Tax=Amphimedon queenslandica TaxID=400682 RepID=A0AAN0IYV8_AMPQE|nr:PREDICTED: uncharacterized protein DDB_G0290685-like [Amphimedon queenslandica]|eukprot:XP_019849954.1 PREDICTED: uncharacterized protein DDB_G0290685-like [Amphimedon queenslandica]